MTEERKITPNFFLAFRSSPLPMWLMSLPEGRYLDVNDCFERMFGYPREDVVGRTSLDIGLWVDPARRAEYLTLLEAQGRVRDFEFDLRTRSGQVRAFSSSSDVVRSPDGRYVVGSGVDLTGRKAVETELRDAEARLREADAHKDQFLAVLSHELRNALAPIRSAAQVLERTDSHDAAMDESRRIIERHVTHLTRLVDDLLDVSRIAHGKIKMATKPVDLGQVIAQAVDVARPLLRQRGHRLTISAGPYPAGVVGDSARLAQVLGNILGNAAKYTGEGGSIDLAVRTVERGVAISVRDSGIGIAEEQLARIFDLYAQGDLGMPLAQGGLGLGLAIARRLVDLHGGEIQAFSAGPGHGSEFVVTLPSRVSRQERPAPRRAGPVRRVRTRRIMIVDDNVDYAASLDTLLTLCGHDVRRARSGAAAIRIAADFRPQVVILDIGLPDATGYDVARRLRGSPATADCLMITVTGYGQDEDRRRARESGIDVHLLKPVSVERLAELIAARSNHETAAARINSSAD